MIEIFINKTHLNEKKYIIEYIFNYYYNIEYKIIFSETENYILKLENGKYLEIKNSFFLNNIKTKELYSLKNIPQKKIFFSSKFCVDKDIPVLFEEGELKLGRKSNYLGIDILASVFFMLTRWEESIVIKKDKHNRFPYEYTAAYKLDFYKRPVVNEWLDFLWNILKFIGVGQKRKKSLFSYQITHDIDYLYYDKLKISDFYNVLNRKKRLKNLFYEFIYNFMDPFDKYDFLMDISDKLNVKSTFFIMVGGNSKFDKGYSVDGLKFKNTIENIKKRKHKIGIHFSYDTMQNISLLRKEKMKIDKIIGFNIIHSRQHYLRVTVPKTLRYLNEIGIKYDYSLGYSDINGFRCGTTNDFPFYDFEKRKKLDIIERPLLIMDTNLVKYKKNLPFIYKYLKEYKKKCKKFNIFFSLLFHNTSFYRLAKVDFKKIYKKILEV